MNILSAEKITNTLNQVLQNPFENEWIELKENWDDPHKLGEYISALSNAAAYQSKSIALLIWGINDETHEIVGTSMNPDCNYNHEPLKHYLARNLKPSIFFQFFEKYYENQRLVVLAISPAKDIPTSFEGNRFFRIGSSTVNLKNYSEYEKTLFSVLLGVKTNETNITHPEKSVAKVMKRPF